MSHGPCDFQVRKVAKGGCRGRRREAGRRRPGFSAGSAGSHAGALGWRQRAGPALGSGDPLADRSPMVEGKRAPRPSSGTGMRGVSELLALVKGSRHPQCQRTLANGCSWPRVLANAEGFANGLASVDGSSTNRADLGHAKLQKAALHASSPVPPTMPRLRRPILGRADSPGGARASGYRTRTPESHDRSQCLKALTPVRRERFSLF
jgi:hypothetical protein